MQPWLAQIAQASDDGAWDRLKPLAYLLIFIVIPLVNAIKDKAVKRAEEKRAAAALGRSAPNGKQTRLPRVEPKHQTARPFGQPARATPSARKAGLQQEPKLALPARPGRGRQAPPPPPQQTPTRIRRLPGERADRKVPRPRPAQAHPAPVPQARAAPKPAKPKQKKPAEPDRPGRRAVRAVNVGDTNLRVDLHSVDPKVRVSLARPLVDVRASDPKADLGRVRAASVPGLVKIGSEALTAEQMRRAVILSELLRPPLALRDGPIAGGW